MYDEKIDIIHEEGTPVQIIRNSTVDTVALIGMVVKSSFEMFAIENMRKGVFLPNINLINGEEIRDVIRDDYFITMGVYPEIYEGKVVSYITMLLKCNAEMTISSYKRTADENGNIKTVLDSTSNIKGYKLMDSEKVKQFDSGILPDAKAVVYIPYNSSIVVGSQVTLNNSKYKVLGVDSGSFENTLVLQLGTDVR